MTATPMQDDDDDGDDDGDYGDGDHHHGDDGNDNNDDTIFFFILLFYVSVQQLYGWCQLHKLFADINNLTFNYLDTFGKFIWQKKKKKLIN